MNKQHLNIIEDISQLDIPEYIDIAVKLGLDSEWHSTIKEQIKDRWHLLFEDLTAVKGLEAFYEKILHIA